MWVFGYGSLMADGWKAQFVCTRRAVAELAGYRCAFNKASVANWGTAKTPSHLRYAGAIKDAPPCRVIGIGAKCLVVILDGWADIRRIAVARRACQQATNFLAYRLGHIASFAVRPDDTTVG